MTERHNKTKYLIYPENKVKNVWDMVMTLVLLLSCVITPLNLAFGNHDQHYDETVLGIVIDVLFALDMIVCFNSACYDNEDDLVENRKEIAVIYLKGWFLIDLVAIIPFDLLFTSNDLHSMARIARIGRLYKLAKLFKLFRVLKLLKEKSKLLKQIHEILNLGAGFERLFFFVVVFFLCTHIAACLWLIMASMQMDFYGTKNYGKTWL